MVQPKVYTLNQAESLSGKNDDVILNDINAEYDRWSDILSDRYNKWLAINK
jgi:hypothetical protein